MAKLIDEKTGMEIKVGDKVVTFRGEDCILESFIKPHKPGSTGKVYVRFANKDYKREYFPSVIGAKIVIGNLE